MLVFLGGCGFSSVREPGAIYIHLLGEPDSLNIMLSSDASQSEINQYIYESLARRNPDTLQFEPLLAEKWTASPDNMHFTFTLKKGIHWTDGPEFTVDDIIYSYKTMMDKDTDDAHLKVYYQDLSEVKKIDRYTVSFTFSKRYYRSFEICASMEILPKHIFDNGEKFNNHKNNRKPVGTGPYIFKEWITGQKIVLERNENYWGKKPDIRKIIFKLVSESNVAFKMLKKEELDFMSMRPIQWARQTSGIAFNSHFQKLKYFTPNYSYIGWNNARPPFNDKRVRRAMTMMINREMISSKLYYGLNKVVSGSFYINSDAYDQTIKPVPYDPQGAVKLMNEAGWLDHDHDGILDKDGKKFEFVFTISSGSASAERIGTIIKEDFAKQGIIMTIERYEWAVFQDKIGKNKNFDAMIGAWSLSFESDPYQLWHSSGIKSGSNFLSYSNPEIDELCDEIRLSSFPEVRKNLYRRFHHLIDEDQPCTFMFCTPSMVVVSKKFETVKVHAAGLDLSEWTVVE
jgi:peptide/nickel transport system substrate-binding protein